MSAQLDYRIHSLPTGYQAIMFDILFLALGEKDIGLVE